MRLTLAEVLLLALVTPLVIAALRARHANRMKGSGAVYERLSSRDAQHALSSLAAALNEHRRVGEDAAPIAGAASVPERGERRG